MRFLSVGGGNIGRAWAALFALRGWSVDLYDTSRSAREEAVQKIRASFDALTEVGYLNVPADVMERISLVSDLQASAFKADYIQENIVERIEEKAALFEELDSAAPLHVIIGSSTSGLAGSRFLEDVPGRARCLIVHPVNPPYLIPLVELCPTPWTSKDVVHRTKDLMTELGQMPVLLSREVNGFLLNRLQVALVSEALHLVGEGYCSVEDIDKCIKFGLGLRWAFMGPFETGHLNANGGYLEYMTKFADFFREIAAELKPDYPWGADLIMQIDKECQKHTPTSRIPERQVWRDMQVMSLLKHLGNERSA